MYESTSEALAHLDELAEKLEQAAYVYSAYMHDRYCPQAQREEALRVLKARRGALRDAQYSAIAYQQMQLPL